jgi:hypothetical protein
MLKRLAFLIFPEKFFPVIIGKNTELLSAGYQKDVSYPTR